MHYTVIGCGREVDAVVVKTERITIPGSRDFKGFPSREAKKEGVSVSLLAHDRCSGNSHGSDRKLPSPESIRGCVNRPWP